MCASEWLYLVREFAEADGYICDVWAGHECSAAYVGAVIDASEIDSHAILRFAANGYFKVWWNCTELYHYGDEGDKLHG